MSNNKNILENLQNKDIADVYSKIHERYLIADLLVREFPKTSSYTDSEKVDIVFATMSIAKDINILERRADTFKKEGKILFRYVQTIFLFAATLATYNMMSNTTTPTEPLAIIIMFIKSFTAYGLLVLAAVTAWKHSKSKHDQAERLYSKRRTQANTMEILLYNNKGKLPLKEILKILEQGKNEKNSFSIEDANAKAPWGSAINDLIKTMATTITALSKNKKGTP